MISENEKVELMSESIHKFVVMSDNIRGRFCVSQEPNDHFISRKISLDLDPLSCGPAVRNQLKADLSTIKTELKKTHPDVVFGYYVISNGRGYDIGCTINR